MILNPIKLIATATCACLCSFILEAQNYTIANPTHQTDFDRVVSSNYNNPIASEDNDIDIDTEAGTIAVPATKVDEVFFGKWIIGFGINSIVDSGTQNFSNLFKTNYNHVGLPFRFNTEYLYNTKLSFGGTILINSFQADKKIQGLTIQKGDEPTYFAVDFAVKLFLVRILNKHAFTPYVTAGPGYKYVSGYEAINDQDLLVQVPKTQDLTLNTSAGTYYWVNENFGFDLNFMAKFALKAGANKAYKTNHTVLSFGVFYRFKNI